ncbi:MAG: hypothetical protein HN811_01160, partial [Phycisphaerae bacterium]|nr:hypothetical protein [Phycisphaerae bacterium]
MAHILHATFTADRFHFWAESIDRWRLVSEAGVPRATSEPKDQVFPWHPYGARRSELVLQLGSAASTGRDDECALRLPRDLLGPFPSDRLAASVGGVDRSGEPWLARFRIATRSFSPAEGLRFLLAATSGDLQFDEEPG